MNKTTASNLKKLREAARYTQEYVAHALGISRSAYSNYESGEREAPYDILEKASTFFGCNMYVFFEDNVNVDELILASALRIDGITPDDTREIMRFKEIIKAYQEMGTI